jgi:hypothetical protein
VQCGKHSGPDVLLLLSLVESAVENVLDSADGCHVLIAGRCWLVLHHQMILDKQRASASSEGLFDTHESFEPLLKS